MMRRTVKIKLFEDEGDCISPDVCGLGGKFPDRCMTCKRETYQAAPETFLEEHKRRMNDLFNRINTVIGTPPGDSQS